MRTVSATKREEGRGHARRTKQRSELNVLPVVRLQNERDWRSMSESRVTRHHIRSVSRSPQKKPGRPQTRHFVTSDVCVSPMKE
jgi:hypothetical protein